MKYINGFFIFSLLLISSCKTRNSESIVKYNIDSLDNKLISIAIDSILNCYESSIPDSTKRIILIDSTNSFFDSKYFNSLNILKEKVKDSSLLNSFIDRNKHKVKISYFLTCKANYILLGKETLKDTFQKYESGVGWKIIQERYKNNYGVMSISRFGINANHNFAMAYFSISFDADNAKKVLVFLELIDNVWKIKEQIILQES